MIGFPSGDYELIHNSRPRVGAYKACSLFSPMHDFTRQKDATDGARAVMEALFDGANRAETDRTADIRAARQDALADAEAAETGDPQLSDTPTRRAVLTAGLAAPADPGDGHA